MATDENAPGAQGNPGENPQGASQPGGQGADTPQGDQGAAYTPQGQQYPQQGQYTPQQGGEQQTGQQYPQQGQYTPQAGNQAQPQNAYAPQGQPYPQQGQQYPQQGQQYPQGQPAAYPAGAYGAQLAKAPNPNKKKFILIGAIAAAVVVLLIAATVVINVVNGSQYGPQAVVSKYLTAISAGKASEANKLVSPGVKDERAALLTNDVLKAADARIKNPKVTDTNRSGDSARVEFTYSLDGTNYDGALTLSNQGKQSVFFDNWKIDKPLLVDLSVWVSEGTEATVNGVNADFGDDASLPAYPAVYTIGPPASDWFEAEDQTIVAATGSKADYDYVELNLEPTQELTDEVQRQLNAMLDECARETSYEIDDTCEMTQNYYDVKEYKEYKREIVEYPTVEVDSSGRTFTTEGGKYKFTVTGTDYYGDPIKGTKDYEPYSYYGDIIIEDGEVVLEFW